ncbi:unnamed protein product [Pieris macdunnoughi]|uniref:Protein FAM161A n=1 Tax=Pieris macdunnoughi TaxID=345717 RepID=A0A821T889_9NEOP|nr:unnamed protein product [Pieris macdunnoughi]
MHRCSVFKNSCVRVPVDPWSKMPKTAYERNDKALNEQSIDSSTTISMSGDNIDTKKLKEFYHSIPDYNDINHLPANEFYSTLKSLREKKKIMLGIAIENIDYDKVYGTMVADCTTIKSTKCDIPLKKNPVANRRVSVENTGGGSVKHQARKTNVNSYTIEVKRDDGPSKNDLILKGSNKKYRPKRNQSACSISWHDDKIENKSEVDEKFDKFFDTEDTNALIDDEFKTQSMPSSPLRSKRAGSGSKHRNVTIPKPFKMTERDEEERIVNELRSLQKSFSEDMLNRKLEKKQFKARPVPIESRIPLYDKILEDQAMRRAITKINSEAELRAQMKPFSFTKREENGSGVCDRAVQAMPKCKKKKKFRARPVPKNLFSNYFYDKIKEDNFFRSMNRRIRAEEMLRNASFPSSMALRERSRLSTPAAHSDLPIDPSPGPGVASVSSGDLRSASPTKGRRKLTKNFITTSPQPFRFNTASRADKKMKEIERIYRDKSDSTSQQCVSEPAKAYSALDLNTAAVGRSNLAALLRAEAVRRKFDIEAAQRMSEQRRKHESKYRDRLLRTKPAWHLVKNNHEEDIAIRLQTRRDEERLRREEFLHEMELMYGRVRQQPMLFERYYAPRPPNTPIDFTQLSPRKSPKKKNLRKKSSCRSSDIEDNLMKYLEKIDNKVFEGSDRV